jgi:hypothetical protein
MLTFHENMSVVVVQVTTKYVSRIWQLTKINLVKAAVSAYVFNYYTGYFTSDNEPNGNENATQNTFPKKLDVEIKIPSFFGNVLWVAFSNPSGSLSLVKYPVYME